jgi:hypothetical protein
MSLSRGGSIGSNFQGPAESNHVTISQFGQAPPHSMSLKEFSCSTNSILTYNCSSTPESKEAYSVLRYAPSIEIRVPVGVGNSGRIGGRVALLYTCAHGNACSAEFQLEHGRTLRNSSPHNNPILGGFCRYLQFVVGCMRISSLVYFVIHMDITKPLQTK